MASTFTPQTKANSRQTGTKAKGMVAISLAEENKDMLEKLDEYALLWEVSRSAAFFRMVSQYERACMWNILPVEWHLRKGKK